MNPWSVDTKIKTMKRVVPTIYGYFFVKPPLVYTHSTFRPLLDPIFTTIWPSNTLFIYLDRYAAISTLNFSILKDRFTLRFTLRTDCGLFIGQEASNGADSDWIRTKFDSQAEQ